MIYKIKYYNNNLYYYNMTYNGGFPPIKYFKKDKKGSQSKERFFAPTKNINIRQMLYTKQTEPLITINPNEEIEIINEI